jgi:hypothetical protein
MTGDIFSERWDLIFMEFPECGFLESFGEYFLVIFGTAFLSFINVTQFSQIFDVPLPLRSAKPYKSLHFCVRILSTIPYLIFVHQFEALITNTYPS